MVQPNLAFRTPGYYRRPYSKGAIQPNPRQKQITDVLLKQTLLLRILSLLVSAITGFDLNGRFSSFLLKNLCRNIVSCLVFPHNKFIFQLAVQS